MGAAGVGAGRLAKDLEKISWERRNCAIKTVGCCHIETLQDFGRILGGFGKDFGRILEGFWRFWKNFGRISWEVSL